MWDSYYGGSTQWIVRPLLTVTVFLAPSTRTPAGVRYPDFIPSMIGNEVVLATANVVRHRECWLQQGAPSIHARAKAQHRNFWLRPLFDRAQEETSIGFHKFGQSRKYAIIDFSNNSHRLYLTIYETMGALVITNEEGSNPKTETPRMFLRRRGPLLTSGTAGGGWSPNDLWGRPLVES